MANQKLNKQCHNRLATFQVDFADSLATGNEYAPVTQTHAIDLMPSMQLGR